MSIAETLDPRFKAHYDQFIGPQVDEFEANRLAALSTMRKRLRIAVPLGIIALVCNLLSASIPEGQFSFWKLLGTITIIAALIAAGWASLPVIQYKTSIKEKIFSDVIRFFGQQWTYNPKGIGGPGIDISDLTGKGFKGGLYELQRIANEHAKDKPKGWYREELTKTMQPYMPFGVIPNHDSAHTEDSLSGTYKDVSLNLFECSLSSGSGKSRKEVFKGLVILLNLSKRFNSHIVVKRDKGSVGNWFGKQFAATLKPVKLEDPRFEKRYEVYGTDQVEARYLLSPSFMERLVTLEDLFAEQQGGKRCNIQCGFKDGQLLFAVPSDHNWFATGSVFKPTNFVGEINMILKQMDQLFAIVDVLKLDDRTGL